MCVSVDRGCLLTVAIREASVRGGSLLCLVSVKHLFQVLSSVKRMIKSNVWVFIAKNQAVDSWRLLPRSWRPPRSIKVTSRPISGCLF